MKKGEGLSVGKGGMIEGGRKGEGVREGKTGGLWVDKGERVEGGKRGSYLWEKEEVLKVWEKWEVTRV